MSLRGPAPFDGLPAAEYGVVFADPPWSFKTFSTKGWKKTPHHHYRCMTLADIQALPVAALCLPDAVCLMWCTAPMLPQGIETLKRWGFAYKSAGAWAKMTRTGNAVMFGTGYIYRSAAEFWILGTRGKPKCLSRSIRNLIIAPVREHSRKPDQMRESIERQFAGPYLELFSRQPAAGWTAWGNETDRFPETPELEAA